MFKHLYKGGQSLLFQKLLYVFPCVVVYGWNVVYSIANGVNVHHAAARHQGHVAVGEKLVEQGKGVGFKARRAIILVEFKMANEVVDGLLLFFGSGGSSSNGQLGKHLPRVGTDDVRGITLGKMQAKCCFANTRRSKNNDKCFHITPYYIYRRMMRYLLATIISP